VHRARLDTKTGGSWPGAPHGVCCICSSAPPPGSPLTLYVQTPGRRRKRGAADVAVLDCHPVQVAPVPHRHGGVLDVEPLHLVGLQGRGGGGQGQSKPVKAGQTPRLRPPAARLPRQPRPGTLPLPRRPKSRAPAQPPNPRAPAAAVPAPDLERLLGALPRRRPALDGHPQQINVIAGLQVQHVAPAAGARVL
jgi:hypothetical protein